MGFSTNLITGVGELLDAENVGKWGGPFIANDTAITVDALPASPDKAVALTLYDVTHDGTGSGSIMGLQCRIRGTANNRTAAKDIADRLFDALHDLRHVTIGGVPVVRIWHQSGTYLGTDSANRPEHTATFYLELVRAGTHRSD